MEIVLLAFAAFVVAALVQGTLRRRRNPYEEVAWAQLPAGLCDELERLLPGFRPGAARLTRLRDEARIEGDRDGERVRIEADFDAAGNLVELEIDTPGHLRGTGSAQLEDLPAAARTELDRLLGDQGPAFEPWRIRVGRTREGEDGYEVKGRAGEWSWEIELTASGRLIELERERKRRRA